MERTNIIFQQVNKKILFSLFVSCFLPIQVFCISNEELVKDIRNKLPYLSDSNVGAIDAEGKYTSDSNFGLNCSGFAKWVIDGFYYPLSKGDKYRYISLIDLREKRKTERSAPELIKYEDSRDPYFGLDWTRNLAYLLEKKRGKTVAYKGNDYIIDGYVNNCGYPIGKIEKILLEDSDKNCLYLGSINGNFGSNPILWQHYHIAIFIPLMIDNEKKILVFERNKETSFSYLLTRYENTFCHLIKISSEGEFELIIPEKK